MSFWQLLAAVLLAVLLVVVFAMMIQYFGKDEVTQAMQIVGGIIFVEFLAYIFLGK